ncbi:histidine kinase [Leptolyngbya sp. AN02str]|uniref:histidine kinase n=1 Tax=Leptolyngbya sp. AN02str TaxID=3423363 RepID=UPI003D31DDE0
MSATPCHIVVDGNPAIIFASRNGAPQKMMPTLVSFLDKFWQERDLSSETAETPEVLVAQLVVRFGFEFSEDDFSNLKVGVNYDPRAQYLYHVGSDRTITTYEPTDDYRQNPTLGLQGCRRFEEQTVGA